MEEIRIDCANPTPEEAELSRFHAQTLFRLNRTMPFTEEYDALISLLFPEMGENSRIVTPLKGVRFNKVSIGKNAVVGAGSVVTKSVEANTIVAGNPARVIRRI
ncbi:MAG: acetyltransferase [Muribaculaceae bacterium]|nr:acetyltransferase [Muribaculaceae bacterium]